MVNKTSRRKSKTPGQPSVTMTLPPQTSGLPHKHSCICPHCKLVLYLWDQGHRRSAHCAFHQLFRTTDSSEGLV